MGSKIKKKLRDVTLEDKIAICDQDYFSDTCRLNCPLFSMCHFHVSYFELNPSKLDEEVEVPINEKPR